MLDIDLSLGKGKSMVQTEFGAARNEWISYMRECSSAYRARKEAERVGIVSEGPADPPAAPDKGVGRGTQAREEGTQGLIFAVAPPRSDQDVRSKTNLWYGKHTWYQYADCFPSRSSW